MKRERLNTAEVEMNNGALDINIWNMLKNRQEAAALINEKFGTEISVDLNFAVFNEDNGNAQSPDEPEEIAQSDNEAQPDGIKEDDAAQPAVADDLADEVRDELEPDGKEDAAEDAEKDNGGDDE
jgi:Phage Connector (GP10).